MQGMVNIARRAARNAGTLLVRAMDRIDRLEIEEKATNDFVSNIDREAEATIVDTIQKAFPDHGVLGEEFGTRNEDSEYTWVIDPLDGTLNYLQGIPHFCVSIGVMHGRHIEHAVVLDPVRDEEFVASRGRGARLNGKRIRVSATTKLADSVFATGIPPAAVRTRLAPYMEQLHRVTGASRAVRRTGSAALDLAYVAAGRTDGFWEPALSVWDIAAGLLLVREAGGLVGDLNGGDTMLKTGDTLAANPRCFRLLVQLFREPRSA